jgi:hypothetical protein
MADNAVTRIVFLDTEAFDHHSRDFTAANLRILLRLASTEEIRVILTAVTENEVRKHLDNDAKDAFKRLQNYKRMSRAVKRILPDPKLQPEDEESVRKDLHQEFDTFLEHAKVEVISIDMVAPGPIFKKYFEQKPPFGAKDKKCEFPDAFAFAALEQWCIDNSAKVYVVGGDGDWKRACKDHANLIYVERLDELLEKFGDSVQVTAVKEALSKVRDDVIEFIKEKAYNLDFYVSDNLVEGELDGIEIDLEVGDFHVVEAKDGKAFVSVPCTLDISGDVTAMDPNSMWTDPDTGELKSVWHLRGSAEHETERDVTMEVTYDPNDTDNVGFKNVQFEDRRVEFDVDEHDLSCSDEDEFEEPDFEPPDYEPPDYEPPDYEPPDHDHEEP